MDHLFIGEKNIFIVFVIAKLVGRHYCGDDSKGFMAEDRISKRKTPKGKIWKNYMFEKNDGVKI